MDFPIGLFDSGFGGLTVMREVARLLPEEHLIYLGDTANLPYGNKSPEKISRLALDNATFLMEKGAKLIIVACHTASSHALEQIRDKLPIPVFGMVEPGLKLASQYKRVALLGTMSTIESGIYQSRLQGEVHAVACPLFVPLIEEGFHNERAAELIAEKYLGHLRGKVDAALLACTHYSLMRPILQKVLGDTVTLIEPAEECVSQVRLYLQSKLWLNQETDKPKYQFFASDAPEKFRKFGEIFFQRSIENVERK